MYTRSPAGPFGRRVQAITRARSYWRSSPPAPSAASRHRRAASAAALTPTSAIGPIALTASGPEAMPTTVTGTVTIQAR